MTAAGIAVVVFAAVLMLALSRGLVERLKATGEPENLLAISRVGQNNMFSSITEDEVVHLWSLPGVAASADGTPLVSPELMHVPFVEAGSGGRPRRAPVQVRGVTAVAFEVHKSVRLTAGRLPEASFEIRAGVKEALARLAYERESLALHRRLLGIREEALGLIGSLVGAGKASQVDHLRARERTALARAALAERSASAAAGRREARLAVGLSPGSEGRKIECSLEAFSATPVGFDVLVELARENSPVLSSARARRAVMDARLAVARTGRVPDITIAAGAGDVELDSGGERNEFRLGISGELPVFDRSQGAIAAARHRLRASARGGEVAAIGVATALSRMLAEYESRRAEAEALGVTVLPAAEKRLTFARDEMEAGKLSKLAYLEHEAETLRLRLQHVRARLMLALAAVQMEEVAGLLAPAE